MDFFCCHLWQMMVVMFPWGFTRVLLYSAPRLAFSYLKKVQSCSCYFNLSQLVLAMVRSNVKVTLCTLVCTFCVTDWLNFIKLLIKEFNYGYKTIYSTSSAIKFFGVREMANSTVPLNIYAQFSDVTGYRMLCMHCAQTFINLNSKYNISSTVSH